MKKNVLLMVLAAFLTFSVSTTPVYAQGEQSFRMYNEVGTVRQDIIGWRFKTVGTQLYKRLYNYSREVWIGEWILC